MNNHFTELTVNLESSTYPIFIGKNLVTRHLLQKYIAAQQVLIVTNQTVATLYLEMLKSHLRAYQCDSITLPDGEQYKNLTTLNTIFDVLIQNKHRRNTTLIALGGGVIGDMAGFAAACYQRGVNFIQYPTTLLAQVDASVGGKTAINHPLGKNLIGAIYQPKAVFIDIDTLATLPEREFRSGLAEIIKAALIADATFFSWLETHMPRLLHKEESYLVESIKRAVAIKVAIVIADEREASVRALLNLGHTFAHGIEQSLGYGTWLHGEAVAVGLVLAANLSYYLGFIDENTLQRIKNILTMAKLPITLPPSLSTAQLIAAMEMDKKKDTANLKFVLLQKLGQAVTNSNISRELLEEVVTKNI
jgi:3-dehydroquinate synthase